MKNQFSILPMYLLALLFAQFPRENFLHRLVDSSRSLQTLLEEADGFFPVGMMLLGSRSDDRLCSSTVALLDSYRNSDELAMFHETG